MTTETVLEVVMIGSIIPYSAGMQALGLLDLGGISHNSDRPGISITIAQIWFASLMHPRFNVPAKKQKPKQTTCC